MKTLTAAIIAVVMLLFVCPAQARPVVAIGDQSTAMLEDPRFQALGVRHTRVVMPYNVMSDHSELVRYRPLLQAARDHNVQVLVAFGHRASGNVMHLPSTREYLREFRRFRRAFPWVREFSPWNEANHGSQPTWNRPKAAAAYFNAVRANCRGCRIVAADVLDRPGFARWLRLFRRHARRPRIWGLHNYGDANRMEDRSVRQLRSATRGGRVWLTETGGIVRFARTWAYDERRAAQATRWVLRSAAKRKVARVYLYQWSGAALGDRWDSGLVAADGRPRPALNAVEAFLRRPLTRLSKAPRIARFPGSP
jgi:hypothetical protein